MINPIFSAAIAAALGRKIKCPSCGHTQVVGKPGSGNSIRCKKCRHAFTRESSRKTPRHPR